MKRVAPYLVFGLAYFAACAVTLATTRLGEGLALVWIATSLLTAKLRIAPVGQFKAILFVSGIGSFMATGLFGLG